MRYEVNTVMPRTWRLLAERSSDNIAGPGFCRSRSSNLGSDAAGGRYAARQQPQAPRQQPQRAPRSICFSLAAASQQAAYWMLGRSPHKNCKNDLDDQT